MRIDQHDAAVDAALSEARASGLYVILRIQDAFDRRFVAVDGAVERHREGRALGIGVHAFAPDGSVGFASIDDLRPEGAREAVRRAGLMVAAARRLGATLAETPSRLASGGRVRLCASTGGTPRAMLDPFTRLLEAQADVHDVEVGVGRTLRTTLAGVDEEWRIVRSDGTDVGFTTSRATIRHEHSGRIDGKPVRAAGTASGDALDEMVAPQTLAQLARRLRRAALDAVAAVSAPAPPAGSYRLVLDPALAKGLAHEAIGHLCESDVDGSVLMRDGRLRVGEQLARRSVSIVDGPLSGDYAQQPYSANGLPRETVTLIEAGMLANGLGDPFTSDGSGISTRSSCRTGTFRDRPTPRMTNIRIEVEDAMHLPIDPDLLTAEDVVAALRRAGLLDQRQPTLYLRGYRGGQAHPRRGDFIFAADTSFDLSDGGAPRGAVSFSGLAERALASIVVGFGPLCTEAAGICQKNGSSVSSSGGSHALLVLDPAPDLIVTAAS